MINTVVPFLDYFFNFSPDRYFPLQWIVWSLIGLAILIAVFIFYKSKTCKDKILRKILQKYPGKFLTIASLLTINLLARIYRVEVFSMRILTYLLIIWLFFSLYKLIHDWLVAFPERKKQLTPKFQRLEEKYGIRKNKGPKSKKTIKKR